MKQSCIDWLIKSYFGGLENCTPHFRKYIEKAKELHKQEIIEAFSWNVHGNDFTKDGIYYYKNTYEKEN